MTRERGPLIARSKGAGRPDTRPPPLLGGTGCAKSAATQGLQVIPCVRVARLPGLSKPQYRLLVVFGHDLALLVYLSDVELCGGVAVLGRSLEPLQGQGVVLRQGSAQLVHHSEVVLGIGVTLLRRLAQPFHRGSVVL